MKLVVLLYAAFLSIMFPAMASEFSLEDSKSIQSAVRDALSMSRSYVRDSAFNINDADKALTKAQSDLQGILEKHCKAQKPIESRYFFYASNSLALLQKLFQIRSHINELTKEKNIYAKLLRNGITSAGKEVLDTKINPCVKNITLKLENLDNEIAHCDEEITRFFDDASGGALMNRNILSMLFKQQSIIVSRYKTILESSRRSLDINKAYLQRDNSVMRGDKIIDFVPDIYGCTGLHGLAIHGHVEKMSRFLSELAQEEKRDSKKGDSIDFINYPDNEGNSALHYAVKKGHIDGVAILLSHGASVHNKNSADETPFSLAIKSGSFDIVNLFFSQAPSECVDFLLSNHSLLTDLFTKAPLTCFEQFPNDLFFAREKKFFSLVMSLLSTRSDVDLLRRFFPWVSAQVNDLDKNKRSPLDNILKSKKPGWQDAALFLIQHGASLSRAAFNERSMYQKIQRLKEKLQNNCQIILTSDLNSDDKKKAVAANMEIQKKVQSMFNEFSLSEPQQPGPKKNVKKSVARKKNAPENPSNQDMCNEFMRLLEKNKFNEAYTYIEHQLFPKDLRRNHKQFLLSQTVVLPWVNYCDQNGIYPFELVVKNNNSSLFRILILAGADLNVESRVGRYKGLRLYFSTVQHKQILKELVDRKIINLHDALDSRGNNFGHILNTRESGLKKNEIKNLFECEYNFDSVNYNGESLMNSFDNRLPSYVEYLQAQQSNNRQALIDLLARFIRRGDTEQVQEMVKGDPSLAYADVDNNLSMLFHSALLKNENILQLLITECLKNKRDLSRTKEHYFKSLLENLIFEAAGEPSPIQLKNSSQKKIKKMLLENGCITPGDIDLYNKKQALIEAVFTESNLEVLSEHRNMMAEPFNPSGCSLLHIAVLCGSDKILEQVIALYPGDINDRDALGNTPLFYARRTSAIDILVAKGADLGCKNYAGQTALFSILAKIEYPESSLIKELLQRFSQFLDVVDAQGDNVFTHVLLVGLSQFELKNIYTAIVSLGDAISPDVINHKGKSNRSFYEYSVLHAL